MDALLGDYRTEAAQDAETAGAITAALLAYYTSSQVDALLGDYRTGAAQDTQTQAAIAGALLAYRTGPDHRTPRPAEFARRRGRALVEARHVWLMARQWGVLFKVRHLMLEPLEAPCCPFSD